METRLQNYLSYFLENGDDVTIICTHVQKGIELPEKVSIQLLPVRHIPKPFRPFAFYRKVNKFLSNDDFDFSLSLGRTKGDYVLAPATHLGYLKYMNKGVRKLSDKMQVYLDEKSYSSSSKVLACSMFIKEELKELYKLKDDKIEVLYPPFNTKKFDRALIKSQSVFKKELGYSDSQIVFLFVSTGHKRKGLDFLLKLFKLLPDSFQLIILGKPEVKTNLSNVSYHGYSKDLGKWYATVDFLIHPAKYEPYGQIISESLYMKTPVLISDKVGAKELVGANEGLVLTEGDVALWQKKIKSIKRDHFSVGDDFIDRNSLSLNDHMEKMLGYKKSHSI